VWERWRVTSLGLRELLECSDAVCVQLSYFSRYQGLLVGSGQAHRRAAGGHAACAARIQVDGPRRAN
jgi:hypothetical protein